MKPRFLIPMLLLAYALAFFFFQACNPESSGTRIAQDSLQADTSNALHPLGEPEKEMMDISGGGEGKYIQGEFTIEKAMTVVYGLYDKKMECSKWVCLPNEKSTFKSVLGPDGHVYTKPSKVLDFSVGNYKHKFLVTESPGRNEGGWEACHACAPVLGIAIFAEIDGDWFVQAFKRDLGTYGEFGELPEPSLVKIGKDNYAVQLECTFTNQGITENSIFLFGMADDKLAEIFEMPSFFSNKGMFFPGYFPEKACEWKGEMQFAPGKNPNYDDLKFTVSGTRQEDPDDINSAIRPVNESKDFVFNGTEYVSALKQ